MQTTLFLAFLGISISSGCQNNSGSQAATQAPESQLEGNANATVLPACCTDQDELAALDGQRVTLRGIYQKVNVSRRPPPLDLTVPGNVSIHTGTVGVMLGIYYEASSVRSVTEIQRLHDREVQVTGTIYARTPEQLHDGMPMQTMIGPYLDVETLVAVDTQTP